MWFGKYLEHFRWQQRGWAKALICEVLPTRGQKSLLQVQWFPHHTWLLWECHLDSIWTTSNNIKEAGEVYYTIVMQMQQKHQIQFYYGSGVTNIKKLPKYLLNFYFLQIISCISCGVLWNISLVCRRPALWWEETNSYQLVAARLSKLYSFYIEIWVKLLLHI